MELSYCILTYNIICVVGICIYNLKLKLHILGIMKAGAIMMKKQGSLINVTNGERKETTNKMFGYWLCTCPL